MTDKARELLRMTLAMLDCQKNMTPELFEYEYLAEEIRAYLAEPEVKREALSDEYIKIHFWRRSEDYRFGFVNGVRFAEKHHGIGGGDE